MSRAAAAALAAAALLAGGCGGEAGPDADAAYEAALDRYLSAEIPATEEYEEEASAAPDLATFADLLEQGLRGSKRRLRDFRAEAEPPDDVRDVHEDLVKTVEEELRLGDEYVAAARAGDERRIERLDALLEPVLARFPDLQRRFDEAGYEVELPEP